MNKLICKWREVKGPNSKNPMSNTKLYKAKHDLINERQNISFLVLNDRANSVKKGEDQRREREEGRKEEEKCMKSKGIELCMDLYRLVWKSHFVYVVKENSY